MTISSFQDWVWYLAFTYDISDWLKVIQERIWLHFRVSKVTKMDNTPDYETNFRREMQALNINKKSLEHSMLLYTKRAKQLSRSKYNLQLIMNGGPRGKIPGSLTPPKEIKKGYPIEDYSFPNYKNQIVFVKQNMNIRREPSILDLHIYNSLAKANLVFDHSRKEKTFPPIKDNYQPKRLQLFCGVDRRRRNVANSKLANQHSQESTMRDSLSDMIPFIHKFDGSIELRTCAVVIHQRDDDQIHINEGIGQYQSSNQQKMYPQNRLKPLRPINGRSLKKAVSDNNEKDPFRDKHKVLGSADSRSRHNVLASETGPHIVTRKSIAGHQEEHPAQIDDVDQEEHPVHIDDGDQEEHLAQIDVGDQEEHPAQLDDGDQEEHPAQIYDVDQDEHPDQIDVGDQEEHPAQIDDGDHKEHLAQIDVGDQEEHPAQLDAGDQEEHPAQIDDVDHEENTVQIDAGDQEKHPDEIDVGDQEENTIEIDADDQEEHPAQIDDGDQEE